MLAWFVFVWGLMFSIVVIIVSIFVDVCVFRIDVCDIVEHGIVCFDPRIDFCVVRSDVGDVCADGI